ncbi:hybrid sensor histidine kinase/response regulator transcription factor [Seonamhaeicola maritimus]|uniref:hybrid sensor histidine kinase/response regulator transcription factor n=1 Tax=Seonamhaeicola maritimus TaxID=2591822 RepID=UPI002493F1F1|nr:hybrid sensor histidine kinase/response regulator transcription factor [Seonamhaeicola maritimus]
MIQRGHFLLLIILCCISSLFAQDKTLEYKQNLTISEGLAHNGVTSIHEDSRGYLWVGTYDGLNRYDGYELKNYKNTVGENILVSNRIRTIAEDNFNNLWIGTDEGLSVYNYSTSKFKNIYSNKLSNLVLDGPIVRRILISSNDDLVFCLTEGSGVLIFNKEQEFLERVIPDKDVFGNDILFFSGIELNNENYLFTTSVGLLQFNLQNKKFKQVLNDEINFSNYITKVNDNTLLVTLRGGIAFINYNLNNLKSSFGLRRKCFESIVINSALVDDSSNLWLGTLNDGLIQINNANDLIKGGEYKTSVFKPNSGILRSSCIVSVSNNTCWYGTFNEGIFKFNMNENPFKHYNIEMNYKNAISTNDVAHISPLDEDRVYLGANPILRSNKGGVGLFNTKTELFEPLPFNISEADKLRAGAIYVDSNKNTWIKIIGKGLYFVRTGSKKMELVQTDEGPDFRRVTPRSFAEDDFGNIWIGCTEDVYKVSLNNNEISKIESLNKNPFFRNDGLSLVRYIYKDPLHDFIWLGADSDGLFRVDLEGNKSVEALKVNRYVNDIDNKLSISSNFVTSIIRLPNEELWVGTEGGGICKVINSDTNPEFISYSEKQGLSNNAVKTILYDDEYNLWIATNVGLNKFDAKELRFRKFGMSDGLPFEDFWFASSTIRNGYFLFSGLDGLCYFKPNTMSNTEPLPRFEFGDIKIFNKSVLPGDSIGNRVLYDKQLRDQDELVLKYNENVFSIQLNSLHFSNPDNHFLKYRLLPTNEEWLEVSSDQQYVYYNGLQPGEYFLEVTASNSLNNWTEPKELKITITPPFWRTNLAYLLYVLLSILLIYAIIKIFLRIQALNHNIEIEQLEKDQVKEINAAKLKFFSNISHELKTPLTLITGPVNNLLSEFSHRFDVKERLQIIERQSKKISQLINQVHDFQKAEAQALKMNYSRFSFNVFIDEFTKDFQFMAENDNKKFEVKGVDHNIIVSADRDKLEKILNNILSNAFKYTQAKGTITVGYKSEDKDLIVSISDTGKGIDKEDLNHIFERFYQSHNFQSVHTSGSGIGLSFAKLLVEMHYGYISADSELGKGTTISLRIPVVKKETSEDQPKVEKDILFAEKGFEFKSQLLEKNNPSNLEVDGAFSEAVIFYAEDNSDMRSYVAKALSKFFKLKTFSNGQECLDAMEDEWPDIVISDVQMPELNGIDLCRTIKSDIKTSHIPVVLLTALTNVDDKIQGIKDGADAYITKPFNVQHLITRTEALLNNRKQLRERFQIGIPLTKENNLNNRNDNAFLEKLYNLIEENLDNQNLDLNTFAKELYLNRTHFYQKVKALTNLTPFEVLKDYRLKKAADFLVQKQVSVNEVYAMTGFKSRTHFSKLFKEKYDITPGKYAANKIKEFNA